MEGMESVSRDHVRDIVWKAVRELSVRYGLECPALVPSLRPFADMTGFDSLHCVEVIVDIAAQLPVDTDNDVFWDEKGAPRTLEQIVTYLHGRVKGGA
jgi:hypothetical protein